MTTAVSASSSPTAMATRARPWWLLLMQGIAAVIIGAVLLWAPAKTKVETWQLLVALLGIYWVIAGIFDLVHMFTDHTGWGWKLFMGLISIMAGGYILMYPVAAAVGLPRIFVLVLGIWGLLQGIVALVLAFRGGGWGLGILGVVGIVFGGFLIANYTAPGAGLTFIWAAAIWGLIGGAIMIVQAFRQRSA
ncbi:MAG: DUF308 domain-containing protein [Ardenticatenaceae bacterium]|nr:DUF308 domain-containing protein [Anaerolineales bacterium]MCB8984373.1 DUF308 domain-containing protein [Ardenticatenaceae bacterium]MCB8987577.1 DUF308 domain-containing protein [Ardenticatenaceae bacterium]